MIVLQTLPMTILHQPQIVLITTKNIKVWRVCLQLRYSKETKIKTILALTWYTSHQTKISRLTLVNPFFHNTRCTMMSLKCLNWLKMSARSKVEWPRFQTKKCLKTILMVKTTILDQKQTCLGLTINSSRIWGNRSSRIETILLCRSFKIISKHTLWMSPIVITFCKIISQRWNGISFIASLYAPENSKTQWHDLMKLQSLRDRLY